MRGRIRPGVVLGDTYQLVRRVGRGGMGEVYEARHARLAGRYAVKILHPAVRNHPEAVARFQREAQITSALRHPGIVQVIDFNTAPNGLPFLVMEYLEGTDLRRVIARESPLSLARVADITAQIASALTAAHRMGVVHRDLKPQNILLLPPEGAEPERVKILDFGISKIRSVSKDITGTSVVLGTPQYMAPEQAEGRPGEVDAAADQFSLAAIVYEMLTGQPAFAGDTLASLVYQIVHATPTPVTSFRPELPNDAQHVIARALSKNKDERFASAADLAAALKLSMQRLPRAAAEDAKTIVSPSAYLQPAPPPRAPARATDGGSSAGDQSGLDAATTSERHSGELARLRHVARSRARILLLAGAAGAAVTLLVALAARPPRADRPRPIAQRPREPAGPTVQPLPPRAPPPAAEPAPAPPSAAAEPESTARAHARANVKRADVVLAPATIRAARPAWPPDLEGALTDPFAASRPPARAGPAPGPPGCAITVGSTPGAELWIDSWFTGRSTPVVDLEVPCGEHQLEFKRPDLGIDTPVPISLRPGQAFRQRYWLKRADDEAR